MANFRWWNLEFLKIFTILLANRSHFVDFVGLKFQKTEELGLLCVLVAMTRFNLRLYGRQVRSTHSTWYKLRKRGLLDSRA